jgi:hypothetical protein
MAKGAVMTDSKSTPGPWRHDTSGNFRKVVEAQSGRTYGEFDSGWRPVATVQDCCASDKYSDKKENRKANIALIAAAPTLLAALKPFAALADLLDDIDDDDVIATSPYGFLISAGEVRAARAAVKLAKGEKS